jgi:cardiolipin synthase
MPRTQTAVTFYSEPGAAWDALYEDCLQAKISIDFEQYIFVDDAAGNRFLRLFAEKARQGVAVRLMIDGIGSRTLTTSKTLRELEAAGVVIHLYNALHWRALLTPSKWLPRSHNKVMLIDSSIAHISSLGIWEVMRHWRELHARLTGPLCVEIHEYFTRLWATHGKKTHFHPPSIATKKAFRFAVSEPHLRRGVVYRELLSQIASAKKRVYIVTPYFLPPRRLKRALREAVRRGVDVRVIMSAATDVRIADLVARSYFPSLLRRKIRIFLYEKTILHAKYIFVDEEWGTMGSMNIDYLSLLQNREANMIIRDKGAIGQMNDIFFDTLNGCTEANIRYYRRLPLYQKIAGYLGRVLKRIL